jgi:rhodanese-related sulfurtransferase
MRRWVLILSGVTLALMLSVPTLGADWVDKGMVSTADKFLAGLPADFYQMDPQAVEKLMGMAKPLVIDVRDLSEWQTERIAGTTHIPIRDLAKKIGQLPDNKGEPIVVLCGVGTRGTIAMTVLRMFGYTNVRNMKGGLTAWKAAGLPVTK